LILHIGAFPFPLPQGSQVYVAGLCRALLRAGANVELACYDSGTPEEHPSAIPTLRPTIRGLPAAHLSGPHWTKLPRDAALLHVVARRLARGDVQIVHAHNVEAPLIAALAAEITRIRSRTRPILLYQLHTTLADELPTYGHPPWFSRPWRAAASAAGSAIDHVIPRLCDAAIAISDGSERHLRATGVPTYRFDPGFDPEELTGANAERGRDRLRLDERAWVLYAGNLDNYQDLPILYEAVRRHPSAGLAIVSHAAEDPAPPLPPSRYRFVGGASFSEVKDAIAACELSAIPRQVCAGVPMKLYNQLALGSPTLGVRGATPEVPGCLLAEPGQRNFTEALGAALERDLAPLRRAARTFAFAACTWDARAASMLDLYATVSHRRRFRRTLP
jgi:glycosyltransferase involved in cell wall biosynthesis